MKLAHSELVTRFGEVKTVLDGKADFWVSGRKRDLGQHVLELDQSIPIITVCNFKGGVGKTTTAANLAAYFDNHGKRVLLIDFDYQGSLTDMLLAASRLTRLEASSRHLIKGEASPELVLGKALSLHPALPKTKLFSAFHGFNHIENELLLRWLTDKDYTDIRYNLHSYLSSKLFQSEFDIVIIDAPPRLTTATVNAACASKYLLIPTILDNLSTEAALNTVKAFDELRKNLSPTLSILGVLPTLVAEKNFNGRETEVLGEFKHRLRSCWTSGRTPEVFENSFICRREAIAKVAGQGLVGGEAKDMFAVLGDVISDRIFANESQPTPSSDGVQQGNVRSFRRATA